MEDVPGAPLVVVETPASFMAPAPPAPEPEHPAPELLATLLDRIAALEAKAAASAGQLEDQVQVSEQLKAEIARIQASPKPLTRLEIDAENARRAAILAAQLL